MGRASPRDIYGRRCSLARGIARRHGCSLLWVSDPVDVEYLCGFRSSRVYLCITRSELRLCTDFRYQDAIAVFCRGHTGFSYTIIKDDGFSFLSRFVRRGTALAFQSDAVTVEQHARMQKELPGVRLRPVASAIAAICAQKSPQEIRHIARACAIGDRALALWLRRLRPGMREQEAAFLLDRLCADAGSEKPAFDTIVLFGARAALPHGRPGSARLRKGDFVLVDFGCTVNGFFSDMTRTFVCGAATSRQRAIYGIVAAAQATARAAVKPGMAARALDGIARTIIEKAGYGDAFGHGLGHGVGLRIHESPRISSRSQDTVLAGNTITIEPGIYLSGFGGVRIEDTVVVTESGCRTLTMFTRELVELY